MDFIVVCLDFRIITDQQDNEDVLGDNADEILEDNMVQEPAEPTTERKKSKN